MSLRSRSRISSASICMQLAVDLTLLVWALLFPPILSQALWAALIVQLSPSGELLLTSLQEALTSTNIEEVFDDILMDLTLKGDKPTVILCGRNIYRAYRQAVRDKFTIPLSEGTAGKRMFDLGFEGCMHNGIPLMYDEDCPVSYAYFINDTYLRLHMLRGVNMKVKELVAPWNVDAVGSRVVWQGQWCLVACLPHPRGDDELAIALAQNHH